MAEKAKKAPKMGDVVGSGTTDEGLEYEDIFINEKLTYRIRELYVDEGDSAWDASQNPDKTYNGRLDSRMRLAFSIVSPAVTVDDIARWNQKRLLAMLAAYDRLNNLPAADAEGNA
jgi:hypothetical protein